MTVTYTGEVATAKAFTLLKLFSKWKGSVFRLIWKEILVYLFLFYIIHIVYMFALTERQQMHFEFIVEYAKKYEDIKTLSFVLGFFVSAVTSRWWNQFKCIPWPHTISVYVSSTLHGYDEVGRAMRRTILRYVNLSLVMVFRVLSPRVKKRFPKMEDLIVAGLINENELVILQQLEAKYPNYSKNWLPICWAANLAIRARSDGRIKDDFALKTIIEELNKFRASCGDLMNYAVICIPLVYVQVVTIAVYTFFITSMLAQQPVHKTIQMDDGTYTRETSGFLYLDYLPFLLELQFIFYMGWLKVAETMINPFGEDDDDFEVNSMIDHNLIMSYLIVDEMHNDHPELLKDQYWCEIPKKLPDMVRDEKKSSEHKMHQQDIFDVEEPPQLRQRRTLIIPHHETHHDTENVNIMPQPTLLTVSASKAELIPRSDVIDDTYRRLTDVELTQSVLDKKMQKIRDRIESAKFSEESDTESEDIRSIIKNSKLL